jgi:hypothetical protein
MYQILLIQELTKKPLLKPPLRIAEVVVEFFLKIFPNIVTLKTFATRRFPRSVTRLGHNPPVLVGRMKYFSLLYVMDNKINF